DDPLAVRRPARRVFKALRGGQTPDGAVRDLEREDVIVEELILIGLAVGREEDFLAVGRPIDGVLIRDPGGELANLASGNLDGKNMEPAVVVEMGKPFARRGLVHVTSDYDGVAAGSGCLGAGGGRDIGDLSAVRRPGNVGTLAWQWG